jgi:hypothetical protein
MNGQQCHAGERLIGIVPKPIRKKPQETQEAADETKARNEQTSP